MKLTNEEFLTEAYRECLDREPDSGDIIITEYIKNGIDGIEIISRNPIKQ